MSADPPLVPDGDQGRELLRRELAEPEYQDDNLLDRMLRWLTDRLDGITAATTDSPVWITVAALLILLGLALTVLALISRTRGDARARPGATSVLGGDEGMTAAQVRARAEAALAAGDHSAAVLDGFRALALGQIELGLVDDLPGATAHELADAVASRHLHLGPALAQAAWWFDLVCYGHRPATAEQAGAVLELDASLRRPATR